MASSFLSKSVNSCVKFSSSPWLLSFLLIIVGLFAGILSPRWIFYFLLLIAVHYSIIHPRCCKAKSTDSPPRIFIITTITYLYALCKKRTSRRTLFLDALLGSCLWFVKEGMHCITLGTKKFVFLHGPDAIESLLSNNTVLRKGFGYKVLKPLLGEGLLTSEGTKWHERRRIMTPAFHFKILDEFIPVLDRNAKIFVRRIEELMRNQECIDIVPAANLCTLDVILETAMGKSMNAQGENSNEYVDAFRTLTKTTINRLISPWMWSDFIFCRTKDGNSCVKLIDVIHKFTMQLINERKLERSEKLKNMKCQDIISSDNDIGRKSKRQLALLDLLLDIHLKDKSMSLQDIAEEVTTFIGAGYHTTAAAISWTLYLLGLHEDVQIQVQNEVDSVLGEDTEKIITTEDIKKLKYLHCVLKETMRLYPPVPIVSRSIDEDIVINGYKINKGTSCSSVIYAVHRNPQVYPNPEEFNPDRFNQENSKNRHPFAYIPFSAGPRNCIGQRFAINEVITVLATALRHFNVTSVEQRDKIKLSFDIVLTSEGGLHLKFTKRKFCGSYSP